MADPHVQIDDAAVRAAFARLIEVGENPSTYLSAISEAIKESTRGRFFSGTAPDGTPWKPVLRGGRPLRSTSTTLMNRVAATVSGSEAFVGVPFGWASVHQFGATIHAKIAQYLRFKINGRYSRKKQVTIPARPIFGISGADRDAISSIIKRAIERK